LTAAALRGSPARGTAIVTWRYTSLLALMLTLAAYAALAIAYAIRTPVWQNPDEPAHYNYVAHVAQTATLPELKPGDWDLPLLERLKNGRMQPGDSIEAIRYEGWQPPVYYLLAAPVYRFAPPDDEARVLALRLFGAVLGGATLVVAYRTAMCVLPGYLALAVPPALAGIPMFTAVSASVSADPLANLIAAWLTLLVVWIFVSRAAPISPRAAAGLGALVGVGVLTKLALAIFGPLLVYVLLLRAAQRVRAVVAMLAACGAVMLPWLVHQVTTYGLTDPFATARHAAVVVDQERFSGLSVDYAMQFLTVTFHSFWAQFGWMAIVAPDRLYWFWGLLSLAAMVGLMRQTRLLLAPGWRLVVAIGLLSLIAYVGYNLAFKQFQGRYLFTALVPMAMLLVAGWSRLVPRRAGPLLAMSFATLLVVANAYTLVRVLVPGFAPSS
jgi:Predicted membrane protein (DUF2142)